MLLKIILLLFVSTRLCDAIVYDRYSCNVATDDQLSQYEENGATSTCTKDIDACNATERRRVDGSCNSLANPMRGTHLVPLRKVLNATYYNGTYPKTSVDGTNLKIPRDIRNQLLLVGKTSSVHFTQAVSGFAAFSFEDVGSYHDIKYYLQNKTNCCTEEGMNSSHCSPNEIPNDDLVHRYSGIRCMNLTTPLTFSDFGCTDDSNSSAIEEATSVLDLSNIYNNEDKGDSVIRSYKGGKLTVDIDENGVIWPPNGDGYCPANQAGETRCFGNYPNSLLSVMLLAIWYMRQHNYFATQLATVNPSWDDETLFQTARDINIAFYNQVYFYEWLPTLIGNDTLRAKGVLANCSKHRDIYDNTTYPQMSLEFIFIHRWFHLMQEGSAFMYDANGTFMKEYPYANFTMRPGYLDVDDNIIYLTQHMFRQQAADISHVVHPDLAENGLPYVQRAVDVVTSDLHKGRLHGLAPYIKYVYFCTGHNVTSFDDLELHIDEERVAHLKRVYKSVEDIDLIAGMWSENMIDGGSVPATFACLMMEHLKKAIQSDRHWYERANRTHAYTEDQLWEIRKASLAGLMCNVADNVTEIQANAFLNIDTYDNPLTACSDIPSIDFTMWAPSNSTSDNSTTTDDTTSSSNATSSLSSSSSTTSNNSTNSSSNSSSSAG